MWCCTQSLLGLQESVFSSRNQEDRFCSQDFPKLLYTVLHGGAQGQSERQADGISADGSPLVVWEDLRVEGERSGFPKELPGTEEKRHPTGRKLPAPSTPAFAGLLGNAQERIGKEEGKEPLPSFAKDALSVFSDLSI